MKSVCSILHQGRVCPSKPMSTHGQERSLAIVAAATLLASFPVPVDGWFDPFTNGTEKCRFFDTSNTSSEHYSERCVQRLVTRSSLLTHALVFPHKLPCMRAMRTKHDGILGRAGFACVSDEAIQQLIGINTSPDFSQPPTTGDCLPCRPGETCPEGSLNRFCTETACPFHSFAKACDVAMPPCESAVMAMTREREAQVHVASLRLFAIAMHGNATNTHSREPHLQTPRP